MSRWLAAGASPFRRQQVLNSLRTVTWPDHALVPQRVRLGGDTHVWLQPHNDEFDFAAVLGGAFNYEPEVFSFLDGRMGDYDAVVEIGANVGVFTLYFTAQLAKWGADRRVYAFEPSRRAGLRLLENLDLNQVTNVSYFNCAVGDRTQFEWLFEPEGHLTNGSLLPDFAAKFSTEVRRTPCLMVNAAQLGELLGTHQRVLLKIDVEGFEAPLLRALAPVIQAKRPDILLEVLPEFEAAINEAAGSVAPGYEYFTITNDGLQVQDRIRAITGRDCFLTPVGAKCRP